MMVENRSLKVSLLMHVGAFLFAFFGLPVLLPEIPQPTPMVLTVDILPISEITNVRPSDKPIQKEQKAPQKTPVKPQPPKPQEKPPEPKPQPKQEKTDTKEEGFNIDEGTEPKKDKPKPKPAEKSDPDFEQLLKDLSKDATEADKDAKDQTSTPENKTISDAPYDESMPLSLSEEDALRSAYIPCWSAPIGAKDAGNLVVIVRAQYNPDGSLIDVQLDASSRGRYNSDPFYRAAGDAALRAVRHPTCNPLKNLPNSLYPKLKDTKITFDPRLMAG